MPLDAWLNGRFVPVAEARVGAFDAGFQHGVGLFETMQARAGRVIRLMEHLQRLHDSARHLGLARTLRLDPLADAVELTLRHNGLQDARIRLTLTAGALNLLSHRTDEEGQGDAPAHHDPTILIHAQPRTPYPPELIERGVGVCVVDARLNPYDPFAGHKTLWYWPRLRALQVAATAGLHEALWFDVAGNLSCGCVSNVFVVKDGVVKTPLARGERAEEGEPRGAAAGADAQTQGTPMVEHPVLPGITRAVVLRIAQELGYAVERTRLDIRDLLGADEVFLTNSSWLVLPVARVEAKELGTFPVAQRIRARLLEEDAKPGSDAS